MSTFDIDGRPGRIIPLHKVVDVMFQPRIYIAADFNLRLDEDFIQFCTSLAKNFTLPTWINLPDNALNYSIAEQRAFALKDKQELLASKLVLFVNREFGSFNSIGKNIELGMAIATNKPIIILTIDKGYHHIFYTLPHFSATSYADALSLIEALMR